MKPEMSALIRNLIRNSVRVYYNRHINTKENMSYQVMYSVKEQGGVLVDKDELKAFIKEKALS